GEPFMVRTELGAPSSAPIDWALAFVHFTDIHLIDAQSPGRVEFLDRFADMQCQSFPLNSAFRPQETLQLQVTESMIRRIRSIRPIPTAGVGLPWWQTFGNHDGLMQGNAPRSDAFNAITVGPLKFDGPPPGINPCDPFASLVNTPPTHPVTADPNRRIVRRHE